LQRLIQVGRDEGLRRIIAYISPENYPMQNISKRLGFRVMHDKDEGLVKVELDL
jgi:acetyltransferase